MGVWLYHSSRFKQKRRITTHFYEKYNHQTMPHDRKSLLHVIYLSNEIFSGTEERKFARILIYYERSYISEARVMARKEELHTTNERATADFLCKHFN